MLQILIYAFDLPFGIFKVLTASVM